MKLIELHMLQSFPVTCLNRDDVGAPKTAYFGGCQRARVSSQCWKRAIREMAQEQAPVLFAGNRSRLFTVKIAEILLAKKLDDKTAQALAKCAAHYLGKLDSKDSAKVKTLMFLSPAEYERLADLLVALPEAKRRELTDAVAKINPAELEKDEVESGEDEDKEDAPTTTTKDKDKPITAKQFTKKVASILKAPIRKVFVDSFVKDAADIAIFGRMVANDHTLTLEAAGLFSHALSTHRTDPDIDFFTAVEDHKKPGDDAGSAMMGTQEFNSACYYRYVGLNLDMLFDKAHLEILKPDERAKALEIILRAAIKGVPSARKNTMFGWNPPAYVLGLKRTGQPLSLVNAFESPVQGKSGYLEPSVEAMKRHWERLSELYCLKADKVELPPENLGELIKKLIEGET